MITFLRGVLCPSPPSRLYLDVGGVGYEVLVPFTSGPSIGQPGDTVTVLTYFHVREQEQTLYGFQTDDERDLFRLLIDRVSGVGPKVALSILSGLAVDDFKRAVVASDTHPLASARRDNHGGEFIELSEQRHVGLPQLGIVFRERQGTVAKVATGAAIGGAFGGRHGARNGAAVGSVAAVLSPGRQVNVPAGTLLDFSITEAIVLP